MVTPFGPYPLSSERHRPTDRVTRGAEYILEDEPPLDVVVPVTAAPPPRQTNLALPLPTQVAEPPAGHRVLD